MKTGDRSQNPGARSQKKRLKPLILTFILTLFFFALYPNPSIAHEVLPPGGTMGGSSSVTDDGTDIVPNTDGRGYKTKSPDGTKSSSWKTDNSGISTLLCPTGGCKFSGKQISGTQSVTCASTGDSNPQTSTLTPSEAEVRYTQNDNDGCNVTVSETGASDGQTVKITNLSSNTLTVLHIAGQAQLKKNQNFALQQSESLRLSYQTDRWVDESTNLLTENDVGGSEELQKTLDTGFWSNTLINPAHPHTTKTSDPTSADCDAIGQTIGQTTSNVLWWCEAVDVAPNAIACVASFNQLGDGTDACSAASGALNIVVDDTYLDIPSGGGNCTQRELTIKANSLNAAVIATDGVAAAELAADSVGDSELITVDSPADEECLTYESTGSTYEYQPCAPNPDVSTLNKSTSDVAISNSTTETSIYSFTISANTLGTDKCVRLTIGGKFKNNSGTGQDVIWRLKYGSASLGAAVNPSYTSLSTDRGYSGQFYVCNDGATNDQELWWAVGVRAEDTAAAWGSAAIDSTANQTLEVTVQLGAADVNFTYDKKFAVLELLP